MNTHMVKQMHFQLKPGDFLTLVGESTTRLWGEQELLFKDVKGDLSTCLLYTSPSPRD